MQENDVEKKSNAEKELEARQRPLNGDCPLTLKDVSAWGSHPSLLLLLLLCFVFSTFEQGLR